MLEPFTFGKHFELFADWLKARGMEAPPLEEMPATGYVYSVEGVPTACGFIRFAEGGHAKVDYLVSNPSQAPEKRNDAINHIVSALVETARQAQVRQLYAHTTDGNTLLRSKSFGFQEFPHSLIALDLRLKG